MINPKQGDIGRLVRYTGCNPPENGRISSMRLRRDGSYDVWVQYGRNVAGALTPVDKLDWG